MQFLIGTASSNQSIFQLYQNTKSENKDYPSKQWTMMTNRIPLHICHLGFIIKSF